MRSLWKSFCLSLCFGATAIAADVPAPPLESGVAPPLESGTAPQEIFNEESYIPPSPDVSGTVAPYEVYSNPTPVAQQRRYYYTPAASSAQTDFRFAGYNGGLTMAIGGTVDELFNAGVQVVVETGWQMSPGDSSFNDVAFTVAFSNQTLWGKDQRSIVLPDGSLIGTETLSISTFKFGSYVGTELGGIDVFTGVYGKVGAAILNEDVEFFDPLVEYTPIENIQETAFAGGVGVELGVALYETEKSSLAVVAGVEYLYLGTFQNPSDSWTLFTTTGFQWEYDITDGILPERDSSPREKKEKPRRNRRCRG